MDSSTAEPTCETRCESTEHPKRRCQLYRHFGPDGELLYVGISLSATNRLGQHRTEAPWFDLIVRVEIETFDSWESAEAAERRAISVEKPIHNRQRITNPRIKPRATAGTFDRTAYQREYMRGWRRRRRAERAKQ